MAATKKPVTKDKAAEKPWTKEKVTNWIVIRALREFGVNTRGGSNVRETIESVVIAFVLAFLFRTFEAEAFVIPTGSMAPTLMGQHKDIECSECKFPYRVNASREEGQQGDLV